MRDPDDEIDEQDLDAEHPFTRERHHNRREARVAMAREMPDEAWERALDDAYDDAVAYEQQCELEKERP